MRVLAAVFTNAWQVSLDIAGIRSCAIEWRRKEPYQPVLAINQVLLDCSHSARRTRRLGGNRDDCPGLGDRVYAAFAVGGGAERCAIVEISASIPLSIPGVKFQRPFKRAQMISPRCGALMLAAALGHPCKLRQVCVEKPRKPDALAFSRGSHAIHPVVPVPCA